MDRESSKLKRQSRSNSKSSTSSKRSPKQSRPPSVVDWPEEQTGSSSQPTQNPILPLSGGYGNELSPGEQYEKIMSMRQNGESSVQPGIDPQIIEPSPRMGESSKSKRQSRSSSKSSTSSKRSPRQSRPPSVVDWAEEPIGSSSQATQSQLLRLHGEEELNNLPPDTLKNKYGKFQVQRGVQVGQALTDGRPTFGRSHSTKIEMTPNRRTRKPSTGYIQGSDVDFVQTIRSGTNNNWRTTARDHGWLGNVNESGQALDSEGNPKFLHRPELTEQETGTGWRVDQKDYNTPFHCEAKEYKGGRHHLMKKSDTAILQDSPTIVEPGFKFDAMTTAMNKKTGKELGTVRWGFGVGQNEQGEHRLESRPPTLLEDDLKLDGAAGEEARQWDRGRMEAYARWDEAAPGKELENIRQIEERVRAGGERSQPKLVKRIPRRN